MRLEKLFPVNIRAAIFDFDGVLVDTERVGLTTCESILNSIGIKLNQREQLDYYQIPDLFFYTNIIESRNLKVDPNTLLMKHKELYAQNIREIHSTLPGVMETIHYFKEKKIMCAICSSSSRKIVEQVLANTHLQPLFDLIVCREDFIQDKPNPDAYKKCLEKLQLVETNCIAFEDTRRGVESAKSAGIITIGVQIGNHGSDQLERADKQIYSFTDLLKQT